ncbi:MAG: hypothetical protein ACRCW3_00820, partial [Metamycoplasmataceae bacterium]
IHNGKLVIMFLISVVLVGFRGKFKHSFASLRHICKHKEGVPTPGYRRLREGAGGDDFAFSHSTWNNSTDQFDGNLRKTESACGSVWKQG